MSENYLVKLDGVEKAFHTRHFLQLDEVTRRRRLYMKRDVYAARGINLGIKPGEIFGLLGPNGAGKTTTVKMISGLVKPDKGKVFVCGLDVERKRKQILRKVGVVLEGTRTSIWPLTPLENLAYYGNLRNVSGRTLRERSHRLLEYLGLMEKKNVQVRYLSRGQRQKLAICIALIADPQIILLDEPTTGLDVQSSRNIKDKILEMTREYGKSALVTTHDMHVAQELCDRIGIINKGELVSCKPTEALINLFSDQVFVFKLDKVPLNKDFSGISGIIDTCMEDTDDGPALVARVAAGLEARSEALYGLIERLRTSGCQLRGVAQRQNNLESVFLELTQDVAQHIPKTVTQNG